jgi:hypothetical protein
MQGWVDAGQGVAPQSCLRTDNQNCHPEQSGPLACERTTESRDLVFPKVAVRPLQTSFYGKSAPGTIEIMNPEWKELAAGLKAQGPSTAALGMTE